MALSVTTELHVNEDVYRYQSADGILTMNSGTPIRLNEQAFWNLLLRTTRNCRLAGETYEVEQKFND